MPNTQTETITKIQLRRGSTSDRTGIELSDGEPGWDTTQKTLYVGQEGAQYPAISVPALGALQYDSDGQLVINFTAGSETVAGFDYSSFSTAFAAYLTDLDNNNTIKKELGTAVGGAVGAGDSALVGPATQTTLGSVIVPDDGGIKVAETGSISVKLGDGIKVNASDGSLEVDTGDGLDIKDGKVVPKLAPGLAIAPDGSLGVDATPAGTTYILYVDGDVTEGGNNGTDGDLYSTWSRKTALNFPTTTPGGNTQVGGAKGTLGGRFKTVMGAYLYALGNLPREIELVIAIMSDTCNWNDAVAHAHWGTTQASLVPGWQWNRQLSNVAPESDSLFNAFNKLNIHYTGPAGYSPSATFPLTVSMKQAVVTVDINRVYSADSNSITTTDTTKGHGFGSRYFIFWFRRGSLGNKFQDIHFKFDFTGGNATNPTGNDNHTFNALVRFEGACAWSIVNCAFTTVGHLGTSGTPRIKYVFEVIEGAVVYFVQNLNVDVRSLETTQDNGSQIYDDLFDANTDRGDSAANLLMVQQGPTIPKTIFFHSFGKFGLDLRFPHPTSYGGSEKRINGVLAGHQTFGVGSSINKGERFTFDHDIGVHMGNATTIQDMIDREAAHATSYFL